MLTSAGILLYRVADSRPLEVFLVHPGGPYFARRDDGVWSIPKGEVDPGEDPLAAAWRELAEETGVQLDLPGDRVQPLPPVRQRSDKTVVGFAARVGPNVATGPVVSNTVPIEWPPRSGRWIDVPEVDRGSWFDLETARQKIVRGQRPLLDAVEALTAAPSDPSAAPAAAAPAAP